MGEVLVARQQELDRPVALKRILSGKIHEVSRRRFLREAVITAQLQHPGIVPIHGLGEDEDGPFYTMPFIRGETLQVAIERFHRDQALRRDSGRRGLELRGLLQRFITICETIAYAHDQGVVHRDLKPSNIMLGPYGETLVMDWGLAKRYQGDGSDADPDAEDPSPSPSPDDLTAVGAVLGTPQFMSPEQAVGRPTSPASDLYSLGVILYAILTGKSPYEVPPGSDRLQLVREAALVPPRQRDPSVPRALQAICLKAMAARPEERYMTARALAEDLAKWLADEPVSAYSPGILSPAGTVGAAAPGGSPGRDGGPGGHCRAGHDRGRARRSGSPRRAGRARPGHGVPFGRTRGQGGGRGQPDSGPPGGGGLLHQDQ